MVSKKSSSKGRWFEPSAGFLVSAILHLFLLLLLAMIARTDLSPSQVQLTMSSSLSDVPAIFQLVEIPRPDSLLAEDVPVEVAAVELEVLKPIVEQTETEPRVVDSATGDTGQGSEPSESDQQEPAVTFFGTHAYGNHFVYVLDVSGSMLSGSGRRIRRARAELIRSISQLTPEQSFYVVAYSNYAIKMFGGRGQPRLIPATADNKRRAARWIGFVSPKGGTEPGGALKIAGDLMPDAVFFLSDGEFVYQSPSTALAEMEQFMQGFGSARPSRFRMRVLKHSPYPKEVLDNYAPEIVVHTVALENESSRHLMAFIAREKGGQHQFIPAIDRSNLQRRQPVR